MGFLLGGILASGIFSVGFSSGIFSGGKLECTRQRGRNKICVGEALKFFQGKHTET